MYLFPLMSKRNAFSIKKASCKYPRYAEIVFAESLTFFVLANVLESFNGLVSEPIDEAIVLDEKSIREEFIRQNAELADKTIKAIQKDLQAKRKRTEELSRLIQLAYEDRLKGKMPEDICIAFIQKYTDEQKRLETEIAESETKLSETNNTIQSADEFIRNVKKYHEAPELTREMC